MPSTAARRVFVSTLDGARPGPGKLIASLEAAGLTIVTAPAERAALAETIAGCDCFVACVDWRYLEDAAMLDQVSLAIAARTEGREPYLFIYWLEKLALPEPFAGLRRDARELPMSASKVAKRLLKDRGKRTPVLSSQPIPPYSAATVIADMGLGDLSTRAEAPAALRAVSLVMLGSRPSRPRACYKIEDGRAPNGVVTLSPTRGRRSTPC